MSISTRYIEDSASADMTRVYKFHLLTYIDASLHKRDLLISRK